MKETEGKRESERKRETVFMWEGKRRKERERDLENRHTLKQREYRIYRKLVEDKYNQSPRTGFTEGSSILCKRNHTHFSPKCRQIFQAASAERERKGGLGGVTGFKMNRRLNYMPGTRQIPQTSFCSTVT